MVPYAKELAFFHSASLVFVVGTQHEYCRESVADHEYYTAIFNSAPGVTCDLSAELYLPAELGVTCDQSKISADSIFGRMLLPRREEILFLIIL